MGIKKADGIPSFILQSIRETSIITKGYRANKTEEVNLEPQIPDFYYNILSTTLSLVFMKLKNRQ